MDLKSLRIFLDVVEQGSYSAVARSRQLAPSRVSRIIAELESELSTRLFHRTTRRLRLTEAGEAYVSRVSVAVGDLELAGREIGDVVGEPRGLLRITATPMLAQMQLPRWLPPFLARYEQLDVEVVTSTSYQDLVRERIDVGLRAGVLESSTLVAKKLCATPRIVVASPTRAGKSALEPADLTRHPCLVYPHEASKGIWWFRDRHGELEQIAVRARVALGEGIALRELALGGEGFALLPRMLVVDDLATRRLVNAFPQHDVTTTAFDTALWLVYPSASYLPRKVRVFVDYMTEVFRHGAPWEQALRGDRPGPEGEAG